MTIRWPLLMFLLLSKFAFATHIIGGNLSSVQTGANTFIISLTIFRDCSENNAPVDSTYSVTIRDAVNESEVQDMNVDKTSVRQVDLTTLCNLPRNLCVEEYEFTGTVTLPDNPNGYLLHTEECCRNNIIENINNPGITGIMWTLTIPDPALLNGNTSPELKPYPTDGILCADYNLTIDFSATDADSDSLAYRLVDPFTSNQFSPTPLPFQPVNWNTGYSSQVPITGNPSIFLDPVTGIASCNADKLGLYVLAYEVLEFRNNMLIGTVRRDLQIQVLACSVDIPSVIIEPVDSVFIFTLGEEQCIDLVATDADVTDTLNLTFSVTPQTTSTSLIQPFPGSAWGIGKASTQICWQPSCTDALSNQSFTIEAKVASNGCNNATIVTKRFIYKIHSTIPEVTALLPNVFSPNGDGISDILKPYSIMEPSCSEKLSITIYNRWGQIVHQSLLSNLSWDGAIKGKTASEGVYFYTVNGTYTSEAVGLKGYFTLIR